MQEHETVSARRTYIEDAWQSYLDMVMPADAGEIQIRETRQAFKAGACLLHALVMGSLSEGDEVEEEDLRLMEDLAHEIETIGQELDASVLGQGPRH